MAVTRRHWLSVCAAISIPGCTALYSGPRTSDPDSSEPTSWPMLGNGPTHRGYSPEASLTTETLSEQWSVHIGGPSTSPVVADGTVFVGGRNFGLAAFDSAGSNEWTRSDIGPELTTPALSADGRTLFVSEFDHTAPDRRQASIRGIDTATGNDRWQTVLPGENDRGYVPTVANDAVYVRTRSGLFVLSATDGRIRWRRSGIPFTVDSEATEYTEMSPAVGDGTVVVPDPVGVSAYSLADHSLRWRKRTGKVRTTPAIVDSTVYFADVMAGVYALDLDTGDQQWGSIGGPGVWTAPAVGNGRVYYSIRNDLVALDASDGSYEWQIRLNDASNAPIVAGDGFVVASSQRAVIAADGAGGLFSDAILWRPGGSGVFSPALANGRLYTSLVGGPSGTGLYAFE